MPRSAVTTTEHDAAVKVAEVLRKQPRRKFHSPVTDVKLLGLYREHGKQWRLISSLMGGSESAFSDDVCRNRVIRMLAKTGEAYVPCVDRKRPVKPAICKRWTREEDQRLFDMLKESKGNDWASLLHLFPGRTKQGIRNRSQRVLRIVRSFETSSDDSTDFADTDTLAAELTARLERSRQSSASRSGRARRRPRPDTAPLLAMPVKPQAPNTQSEACIQIVNQVSEIESLGVDEESNCLEFEFYLPDLVQHVSDLGE